MTKAQNMLDEKGNLRPEIARKAALWGGIVGAVIWGAVAVGAAIMLVGMGLWAWVVWPLAFYWYMGHLGRSAKAYKNAVNPQKWEQHVTINVPAEMTADQLAAAADRAINEKLTYSR